MFTLKIFTDLKPQVPSVPAYRCIAAREFEVYPSTVKDRWLSLYWTGLDGVAAQFELRDNEYVFVENAAGKTIDKLKRIEPDALKNNDPAPATAPLH